MKRVILLYCILCAIGQTMFAANMLNLGLPSGTIWAEEDEEGTYTYYEANAIFGKNLPTLEQYQELLKYCKVTPEGDGVRLTGPNGKSIVMSYDNFHCYVPNDSYTTGVRLTEGISRQGKNTISLSTHYRHHFDLHKVHEAYRYTDYEKRKIENPDVNLDLPSGTKWKAMPEDSLCSYDQLCTLYKANELPTEKEWKELMNQCTWKWIGHGYRITNKNGKGESLYLPLLGYYNMQKGESDNWAGGDTVGVYWVNPYPYTKRTNRFAFFSYNPCTNKEKKITTTGQKMYYAVHCISTLEPHVLCRMTRTTVDMGLPSRTYWYSYTEDKEQTWQSAMSNHRSELPTLDNYKELFKYCKVKYYRALYNFVTEDMFENCMRTDMLVIAPNGNQIYLRGPFLWTKTECQDGGAAALQILDNKIKYISDGKKDVINVHRVHK